MTAKSIHVVIWLPFDFYAAVVSTLVEMFQLVNDVSGSQVLSYEFVSRASPATSATGISFPTNPMSSRKMDVLILIAMPGAEIPELLRSLDEESEYSKPLIALARQQEALIAAHCGACYLLADTGLLDGKRATISWWLKSHVSGRFPHVQWDSSRMLVRDGRLYTCGGGFSGLELAKALLVDLGFSKEERIVRKLLVLPPSRKFQSPYEFPLEDLPKETNPLENKLRDLSENKIREIDLSFLAAGLGLSARTLSRRMASELKTTPGKWIQEKRFELARSLLEGTKLSISEICYRVGYQDVASFSRTFSKTTGMAPGEFRKQIRP
ncbi:GlxA family transcriptional regulator [Mesorhizobium sp.]|uniref:GlxA family transcriptional regulator n=1 Tax=Mesorhizobium sp. TaxID=1871066 RepID=UPI000FE86753|nr:helix-turn-helix domain-containing protein [Mesorhizobium sp.]RWC30275.1 MAG: helix-turn-helix domain-containing protein [Mesorhizobium sp.]TIX26595.1 MAG: helix-turn-helix domain-containing protein [Mesorhizobium sp.]